MLYDLAAEPPRPGSVLESVFILMAMRRQEAEYFRTKTLVMATIVDKFKDGGKALEDAMNEYRSLLFPFLAEEKKKGDLETKKALKQWTKHMLKVKPLWRAQDHRGVVSKLRRGSEQIRKAEALRRQRPHRRLD